MKLEDCKIILASGSPRRIKILKDDGQNFQIIKPDCAENIHLQLEPKQYVMALALRKALSVKEALSNEAISTLEQEPCTIIIACDTIVAHKGKIIGKPRDRIDAFNILSSLKAEKHQVWSGVALINLQKNAKFTLVFNSVTDVYFKSYSEKNIWDYIDSGEPMDKAGAYAIQGDFGKYIDHIDGEYDNVVGFPYKDIKAKLLKL